MRKTACQRDHDLAAAKAHGMSFRISCIIGSTAARLDKWGCL
jgi:hypothetical protein